MQISFDTNRLLLDVLTAEDSEFIISLVNSKEWIEFIGERNVHSKQEAVAYINKILNTQNFYYWVIRIKDGMTPIGIISFLKREYLENFDIGFALLPEFTGNGYAFEAAKKVMSVVQTNQDYHPILATTLPNNINSIKLLIKLGFYFEKEIESGNEKLLVYSNSTIPGANPG